MEKLPGKSEKSPAFERLLLPKFLSKDVCDISLNR